MEEKKHISLDERKEIMISILAEIDEYCQMNHLTYFLIGGSLLGAVRHQGFIPWDDDMDIGLPRKDYETLINEFHSTSGHVELLNYKKKKGYIWPNAKAIDNRTMLWENGKQEIEIGVFVDVFPIDGIKGNYQQALKKTKRIIKWKDVLTLKHLNNDIHRSLMKKLIISLGRILYLIPDSFFIQKINAGEKEPVDLESCEYACNLAGAWGERELAKSKCFHHTIERPFENRMFRIPVGYDEYLRTVYGDYMVLPPKEKQITHHDSEAYWR